jgi:hypothetical protein
MKIISFPLRHCIAALFLLALPAAVQAQFTFTTNNNSITIIGYTGPGGAVVIPDATNGYAVTGIGDFSFEDGSNLTSVTIPDSVTNIGQAPFLGCSSLTNISVNATNSVFLSANGVLIDYRNFTLIQYPNGLTNETYTIPNGYPGFVVVTNIGPYAFASCDSLKSIIYSGIDGSLYTIGDFAFSGCTGLTSVIITNKYLSHAAPTSIGAQAFSYCTSLTKAFFITPISDIGGLAFEFCTNLTAAYFPSNAPPDVGNAFYGDPDAVVYYMPGSTGWGPTFGGAPTVEETFEFVYRVIGFINGSIDITGYNGPAGAVVIPGTINGYTVSSIGTGSGQSAFGYFRTNILSVVIPDTVTNILQNAFENCRSLTNIIIPDSVISIGRSAFELCTSLASIAIPDSVASISGSVFFGCTNLTNISVDAANPSYSSLNGILFDKAQETLVAYPAGLTNSIYTIPNSVTNIGESAFGGCAWLTEVIIPNSVTGVGGNAFVACNRLTSIVIPSSVTSIGEEAFDECASLSSVFFLGNAPDALGQLFLTGPSSIPTSIYYLPGTTGWGATFGDSPTELWNPHATSFTTAGGQFGFNITGPTNAVIVVVACTNLANPTWFPVSTNTLSSSGTSSFSDPQLPNNPNRYFRFTAP